MYQHPIYNFNSDDRPHIDVKIKGRVYRALIDSGSQLTVINANWITNDEDWGTRLEKLVELQTADTVTHPANPTMRIPFEFNDQIRDIEVTLYDRPIDKIIIGTKFMKAFGIEVRLNIQQTTDKTRRCFELSHGEHIQEIKNFKRALRNAQKPRKEVFIMKSTKQCCEINVKNDDSCMLRYIPKQVEDYERPKIETVTRPHVLNIEQQKVLQKAKEMFQYTTTEGELNATDQIVHHIDTGDAEPVVKRQYPLSPYQLTEAKKKIEEMEKLGIVRKITHSNWRSPMLPVPKPDGSLRICLDAKGLNKVTIVNTYPMPDVNIILAQLKKTKYITAIDLSQAFFQVRLDEESQLKTAFVLGNQLYCYKRMTMGLRNSPATLASLIESIFRDLQPKAFAYCDDFLVCSETFEEHVLVLEEIANRLKKANLSISSTKSNFCCSQLKFLGYLLSEKGLEIDPERKKAIINYKKPVTVKQIRSFLGAVGWVSRFIKNYADKSAPLIELIKGAKSKSTKVKWTPKADEAFLVLKNEMISDTVLTMCDYNKQFKLYTDASDIAGAGVLRQEFEDGEKPIFYYSFKFNKAEMNYSTTERECLAVIRSLEKFSYYIKGSTLPVLVYTDHLALKYLKEMKNKTGRLARWAIRADEFNFEVHKVPGKENELADCLSREVDYEDEYHSATEEISEVVTPSQVENSTKRRNISSKSSLNIENTVTTDKKVELIEIKGEIKDKWYLKNFEKAKKEENQNFKVVNNELYFKRPPTIYNSEAKWVLCIPKDKRKKVLEEQHDQKSHPGSWRTVANIKNKYHWPGLYEYSYNYVSKCQICRMTKPSTESREAPIGEFRDPKRIGHTLSIDFIGPFPRSNSYTVLLVVIDCFSKYLFVKPMNKPTAKGVVLFLEETVFDINGTPATIISDNGQQFTSNLFQDMCNRRNINHMKTAIYHPRANPVESTNKTIKNALKAKLIGLKNHSTWSQHIKKIVSDYNSTVHTVTGVSPYFLQFGRELITSGDEYKRLIEVNDETPTVLIQNNDKSEKENSTKDPNKTNENIDEILNEKQIHGKLIREQVLENIRKSFDKNKETKNKTRNSSRKFEIGQQIYYENKKLSNKAENYSQGLAERKKVGYIKRKIGNDMYEIVDSQNNTVGTIHSQDILLR